MRRLIPVLGLVLVLSASLSMTSCGGSGSSGGDGSSTDLVLLGFNHPNISGVVLNAPLIFTFSQNISPISITPDTLRVVGSRAPFFETTVVDGNLVALLPTMPNFATYEDAGFAPGITYTVSLPVFPAPSTISTPGGNPLLSAQSYSFQTVPAPAFMEHPRPVRHGLPPSQGGTSDDDGCLQNPNNSLYEVPPQFQSNGGSTLLCLMNEGQPRVLGSATETTPFHDQRAVGTPSSAQFGKIDMPAIRVQFNEALDPLSVVPWVTSTQLSVNIQLWRVAQKDGTSLGDFIEQVQTNEPRIIQSLNGVEIILVPTGPVLQGIYCVVARPALRDLAQNPLRTDDSPDASIGGYTQYDNNPALPQGWRLYFHTLTVPNTPQAINESFASNAAEHGDLESGDTEPGIFTYTTGGDPLTPIPGTNVAAPQYTLANSLDGCGQTTTGNWNSTGSTGYRFLNLPGLNVNVDGGGGADVLRPTWIPYTGTGSDGEFSTTGGGDQVSLNTDTASSDGILQYTSFTLAANDTLTVHGSKPLLIFCQGDFIVDGEIFLSGGDGGVGLDTDGSGYYENAGSVPAGGKGGDAGPGAGAGGGGANPAPPAGVAQTNGAGGSGSTSLFGTLGLGAAGGGAGSTTEAQGGGGGGFGGSGFGGSDTSGDPISNAGAAFGDSVFSKDLADFEPDRGYQPGANITGGGGAGGGSAVDTDGSTNASNGDAGGGGGGGAGGGLWVICTGKIEVNGAIYANGGNGGSVYSVLQQAVDFGPDGDPSDDIVTGILPGQVATPMGAGGPGGGGAGGGIFLVAKGDVDINGILQANGGDGGASGSSAAGGDGADGRIALAVMEPTGESADGSVDTTGASISPGATSTTWAPTITENSVGQSEWFDLSIPTTDFDPDGTNPPTYNTNFDYLTMTEGLTQGPAGDFDAVLEFQGADALPSTGVTTWSADINTLDGKRFLRWRFRFFVNEDTYPGLGSGAIQLPQIQDLLIPYETN